MTQRTVAGVLAVPLLIGLWLAAALHPLPYVTYEPGLTVDVLGTNDQGDEIIEVRQWDVVRVPPEAMRGFEAGSDGAEIIAVGAPNTGDNPTSDGEMTPGWWSD